MAIKKVKDSNIKWGYSISFILLILYFTLLTGCGSSETLDRIQADGVIRVGLDPTFPPFENGDYGVLEGLDVDLANLIGREIGVEVEFVLLGYDGLYDALLIEQCDILISALVIDPAKQKDFAFSKPYFNAGQYLFVHETNPDITSLIDLEGKSIAVETGSAGQVEAISTKNSLKDLQIQTLSTADDALWTVLQLENDAALVDQVNGRLYLQQQPVLEMILNPVTVEPYAIVTRKADSALLNEMDRILANLLPSDEWKQVENKWLGPK
ncbi:MAG: transporter substrate-binding domain-containing protein [Chloroflexota bacterium]